MQLSDCFVQDMSQTFTGGSVYIYYVLIFFILASNIALIYGFYKTSRPFFIATKLFILLSICDISCCSSLVFAVFGMLKIELPSCTVYMVLFSLNTFLYMYVSCILRRFVLYATLLFEDPSY